MRGEQAEQVARLAAAARALKNWRQQFGGPGRRIPDALWSEAAEVARSHGIGETARALRLDARKLASIAADATATHPVPAVSPTFVEIGGLEVGPRHESVRVELVGREGDQVRVDLPAGSRGAVDVVELARAFWSRRR